MQQKKAKQEEQNFTKAVQQLGIKMRKDDADKQQIKFILFQILGYPNLQSAYEHHNASRLGTNDLLSKQLEIQNKVKQKRISEFQICNCCGLLLQNDQLDYWTNLNQINLGIGVVLFFKDLLYYSFIFMMMFLIYSIYAMATNSISFDSSKQTRDFICSQLSGCGLSNIAAGSKVLVQNESKNLMSKIQSWIGVGFAVFWGIMNIVKTHYEQKQMAEIQTKRVSASDFTLMIQNFPKKLLGESQQQCLRNVQDVFNKYYQQQKTRRQVQIDYQIVSVNIARSLYTENRRNVERKQKVMKQLHERQDIFRQWIKQRRQHQRFLHDFQSRQRKYQQYSDYFTQIFHKQLYPKIQLEQKNTIFVTMKNSKARQQIEINNAPTHILKFWKYFKQSDFPIKDVKITKAPEPQEIKWQNIGFPSGKRNLRRIFAWGVTMLLIAISLGINIGFSSIEQEKRTMEVSVLISIVITLINLGIQLAIVYFSSLQYQYIYSWEQSSLAIKIAFGQLVNSIGVPIVVAIISKLKNNNNKKTLLKANGLADDIFFIALLNILVPISGLIDFYELILKFIRWWKSNPDSRLQMYGQKQLNKYYGNYKFDIGYQYAFLIKTSIFTSFFVCMQPIIALFAPFALIFFYKSTKRNMFYHFQRPGYHYATTNNTVDVLLLFSILFFGIGCLFVNNQNQELNGMENGTKIINLIIIFVACAFLIIVPFRIFYCCIPKPEIQNKVYFQKKMLLYTDYDRTNPITKDSAITEFQHYLRSCQELQANLPDQVQFVKLRSTIQYNQIIIKENDQINQLRNSVARLSRLSFRHQKLPPIRGREPKQYLEIKIEPEQPQYNDDMAYFEQIAYQPSIHIGKQYSPQRGMSLQVPSEIDLFRMGKNKVLAQESHIGLKTKTEQ